MPSIYAKRQLAEKLGVCSKGHFPILFNYRPPSSDHWLLKAVAISGRAEGRIDGVDFLVSLLKDGIENHSASSISIPKWAVVQDESKCSKVPPMASFQLPPHEI